MPRAGLATPTVTEAGAVLADEVGIDRLGMGLLAERLGVKTPSLYKHVAGLEDLKRRIAVAAIDELTTLVSDATQGLTGRDALHAAAQTVRAYVLEHPGRYAAGNSASPSGSDDPLVPAVERFLDSLADVLRGYPLTAATRTHALRLLRSCLHGFATLEAAGGFRLGTDVDKSFQWTVDLLDRGLRDLDPTS